jgi:site-specific DNA recombinase
MLRNPAYCGKAVFGKTRVTHEAAGLNRTARLAGRTVPRQVRVQDQPREEWTEIPVPALVDEETFERVQRRLEDNKRFASRNAKVPSLLQGLAACSSCGYGYYRTSTTTTTSSGKKIYYYRCLGSDDYRYQGGRVCQNKPVRADYVDAVIWDHVTVLLADPALIRSEIGKRRQRARTSDPVTKKRGQLDQALAKTSTSIAAMVTAFSEQLITIDELRARMPALRTRETSLKDQLAALDAQAADRDAYLRLAGDLEGFLAKLRANTATATTEDRQRVLRAVVQDVLIGPEKLTIRHRIPVREHAASGGSHDTTTDTEGDMRKSSQLRWGRGRCPLRCALLALRPRPVLDDPRGQPLADQPQDPLIRDPVPEEPLQPVPIQAAEEVADIRVQHPVHPLAVDPGRQRVQRVMRLAPRPETVGETPEVRLVDGVQHLDDGPLDNLVFQRGDAERPQPPVRLRDIHPPRRPGPVAPRLHPLAQVPEISPQVLLVLPPRHTIHTRRRILLQLVERQAQPVHRHVVQQRGEPRILIPSRDLAHTVPPI